MSRGPLIVEKDSPLDKISKKYMKPSVDICEVLGCSANRRIKLHRCYSGLCGELHVAASSKESWDPNKLKDGKNLTFRLA